MMFREIVAKKGLIFWGQRGLSRAVNTADLILATSSDLFIIHIEALAGGCHRSPLVWSSKSPLQQK